MFESASMCKQVHNVVADLLLLQFFVRRSHNSIRWIKTVQGNFLPCCGRRRRR